MCNVEKEIWFRIFILSIITSLGNELYQPYGASWWYHMGIMGI